MILAIESSCDDSGLALFSPEKGFLGEWVYRQTKLHEPYGGVVPDLASREHMAWLPRLLKQSWRDINSQPIKRIAVTVGPGLPGSLAVGIAFAQALSLSLQLPLVPVNHLKGHALSAFIPHYEKNQSLNILEELDPYLPHLGLLVSGSNTLLFSIDKTWRYSILAETLDDAAGEALDKAAKLLGMEYPGGPLIEAYAQRGNPKAYDFPRAFSDKQDLKFSFSGLKTSLRYRLEAMEEEALTHALPDLCASYQEAVVDALIRKTLQALKLKCFKSIGLSGGVAKNQSLRERLKLVADRASLPLFLADPRHTGDNAGMIAFAAWLEGLYLKEGASILNAQQFYPSLSLV